MRLLVADPQIDLKELERHFGPLPDITILVQRRGKYSTLDMLEELEYNVDGVIVNLVQPRGDGITLTRELRWNEQFWREASQPIAIFWITDQCVDCASTADPVAIAQSELDVREIFTGPYDPIQIVQHVYETLRQVKSAGE